MIALDITYRPQEEIIPSGLSTLNIALPEAGNYTVHIFDRSGRRHSVTKATNSLGVLTINLATELPSKLFNSFAGKYKMYFLKDSEVVLFEGFEGIIIECINVFPAEDSHTINLSGSDVVVEEPEPTSVFDFTFDETF